MPIHVCATHHPPPPPPPLVDQSPSRLPSTSRQHSVHFSTFSFLATPNPSSLASHLDPTAALRRPTLPIISLLSPPDPSYLTTTQQDIAASPSTGAPPTPCPTLLKVTRAAPLRCPLTLASFLLVADRVATTRYEREHARARSSANRTQDSQRPSRPASPPHPFLPSPTASESRSRLTESRTPSSPGTPPFPGPGLDGIPSIDDMEASATSLSGIGVGLLFDAPDGSGGDPRGSSTPARHAQIPDPYGASSDSEGEIELDLDRVAEARRSLLKPTPAAPRDGRSRKGWLAHHSVFPSSSSSEASESDKETEDESVVHQRFGLMGQSRRQPPPATPIPVSTAYQYALDEPLLGPDEVAQMTTRVPVRLQVYHGRFGHWEREGLRKYKGELTPPRLANSTDPAFLALWLTTLLGVLFGLLFVWGSSDVSLLHARC